jgi:endonuclease/exonuclease/phosphatase (EEP) superfamily protein YafD
MVICLLSIKPYLFFARKSIEDAEADDAGTVLKILIYNVLYSNEKYSEFVSLANREDADIILLLEPGESWEEGIQTLQIDYRHLIKEIREDTYGIMMMSRVPYLEAKVNHIVSHNIPSVEALVAIGNQHVRIFGLHPEPPVPGERLTSKPKDLELLRTAHKIVSQPRDELDIMVGDLNDVGWSKVSTTFKIITGMSDPREGRGFYSTFPTFLPLRIPIDHVFCSPDFKLIDFKIHENIGSDHFPVSVMFSVPTKNR